MGSISRSLAWSTTVLNLIDRPDGPPFADAVVARAACALSASSSAAWAATFTAVVGLTPHTSRATVPNNPAEADWTGLGRAPAMSHSSTACCQAATEMDAKMRGRVVPDAPNFAKKVPLGDEGASAPSGRCARSHQSAIASAVCMASISSCVGSVPDRDIADNASMLKTGGMEAKRQRDGEGNCAVQTLTPEAAVTRKGTRRASDPGGNTVTEPKLPLEPKWQRVKRNQG